jgi:O-antigen/teichoic acid export membrane protein
MSVASAGLVNVAAALLLVPTFGEQGMALSVVSAEAFAVVALAYHLRSRFPSLRPRSHATRDAR